MVGGGGGDARDANPVEWTRREVRYGSRIWEDVLSDYRKLVLLISRPNPTDPRLTSRLGVRVRANLGAGANVPKDR